MSLDGTPWTPEERAILAEVYAAGGYKAAVKALPHRTKSSLMRRAQRDGVLRRRRWTDSDDARLREMWNDGCSLARIATQIKRTQATTYWRAQKLGLPLGCPPDFEHLTAAACRTGFDTKALRRVLAWAKVPVKRAISRPTKSRTGHRFHIVETIAVDEAVAAWLRAEPVKRMAGRVGVSGAWLRELAHRAGYTTPGHKHRLRLTDEQAKALVADVSLRRPRGGDRRKAVAA